MGILPLLVSERFRCVLQAVPNSTLGASEALEDFTCNT